MVHRQRTAEAELEALGRDVHPSGVDRTWVCASLCCAGSARLKQSSAHWDRARELGRDVAKLLGVTTWSGGGPGMMQAASLGAHPLPRQTFARVDGMRHE